MLGTAISYTMHSDRALIKAFRRSSKVLLPSLAIAMASLTFLIMPFRVSATVLPLRPDVLSACPAKFVAPAQPLRAEIDAAFEVAFAATNPGASTDPATRPLIDNQYAVLACSADAFS